jgi:hypothetical protein
LRSLRDMGESRGVGSQKAGGAAGFAMDILRDTGVEGVVRSQKAEGASGFALAAELSASAAALKDLPDLAKIR